MARCAILALAVVLGSNELHGQSATEQQRETEAVAKAQAIALGGGPEALTAEIAAELADLGRYEDRLLTGTLGPALKNFPQETSAAFKRLDFEIQLNLLTFSWERFAFPAMAPILKALYQSPPDDSARLRDISLRRLYQLNATEARPLMLNELQRSDLRVSMTTLSLLPDAAFPAYEEAWLRALAQGVLDERIDAAVRLERFGSPAVLPEVKRLYAEQGSRWSCDVRVSALAYLAQHDRATANPLIGAAAAGDRECAELIHRHPRLRDVKIQVEEVAGDARRQR